MQTFNNFHSADYLTYKVAPNVLNENKWFKSQPDLGYVTVFMYGCIQDIFYSHYNDY